MEIRELRIGNLLLYNNEKVSVIAIQGDKDDGDRVMLSYVNSEHMAYVYIKNATPIPITEEILLKCGFNKDYSKGYIGIDVGNSDFVLTYPKIMGQWQVNFAYQYETGGVYKFVNIKHLHQLQNLYFSLTGEELKIEL